eukprot:Gb_04380 [translate_table: standard]
MDVLLSNEMAIHTVDLSLVRLMSKVMLKLLRLCKGVGDIVKVLEIERMSGRHGEQVGAYVRLETWKWEYHLGQLKAKIAKLRTQLLEPPKGASAGGDGFEVTKFGHGRVALIGFPRKLLCDSHFIATEVILGICSNNIAVNLTDFTLSAMISLSMRNAIMAATRCFRSCQINFEVYAVDLLGSQTSMEASPNSPSNLFKATLGLINGMAFNKPFEVLVSSI